MKRTLEGYTITAERVTEGSAKGWYRGKVNGAVVCCNYTKKAAVANAEFIVKTAPQAILDALLRPAIA